MKFFAPSIMLVLVMLLGAPDGAAVADEKPEQTFKDKNVRWTLPDDRWEFGQVTLEQEDDGYYTKVERVGVKVDIYAGTKGSNGLNLSHLSLEMLEQARRELSEIVAFNQGTGTVSDLEGIHVWARGTLGGADVHISYHCILAKGVFYFFYVRAWNGNEKTYASEIDEVRSGLRLIKMPPKGKTAGSAKAKPPSKPAPSDTPEAKDPAAGGVSGPLAGLVEPSTAERGEERDEEMTIRRMAVILEKPKGIYSIEPTGYQVCLLETRETPTSYFYFDAISEPKRDKTADDLPAFAEKRAQEWLAVAGGEANIGSRKNDLPKLKKDKWSKGNGFSWEFTGAHEGVPFTEHGWVVIFKQRIFVVRAQLGGEGAGKTYKKLLKAIEKNWTFE